MIEFGWDMPDAAFMRQHVGELKRTPFDGCVFEVLYDRPDGSKGHFMWEGWGKRAFSDAELATARADLEATDFGGFSKNFLRFNVSPGDVDWFEDFSAIRNNAQLAARLARAGRAQGILFDTEAYSAELFHYRKQRHAATKTWEEYASQARQRGREVMEAFQAGNPGLTLFLTFGYSAVLIESQTKKKSLAECEDGLLVPFLDGLVDAARGRTRIVDGFELSYGFQDRRRFEAAYRKMSQDALILVANPRKYRQVFSFGFGIWMDYRSGEKGWSLDRVDTNYFPPELLAASVRDALAISDEYVWIYSQKPRWWTSAGKSAQLPDGYWRALKKARSDQGPFFRTQ